MAKRAADPILSLDFFSTGWWTYRNPLFTAYKGIGVNVVQFHDAVIDGSDFELLDKFEWQRRPGFSIFCSEPLPDAEIVNQFYSARNLNGEVLSFVDTSEHLSTFTSTEITPVITKSTTAQGYVAVVGNKTYFADGNSADALKWDGSLVSIWGLTAPTVTPAASGMGFWQSETSSSQIGTILDPNGNVESVSRVLTPNGTLLSPADYSVVPIPGGGGNGGVAANWVPYPAGGPTFYASQTATFNSCFTYYLDLQDFGPARIPDNATILGIELLLYKYCQQDVSGFGAVTDRSIQLIIGGVPSGSNLAVGTPWSASGFFPTIYGSSTSLWGLGGTLTPSVINAGGSGGFGVAITADIDTSAHNTHAVVGTAAPFAPVITVYYSVPSGAPTSGVSGINEPNWPTQLSAITTDGSINWTNYGPIGTWYPNTNYPTPVVILDTNGFLEVGVSVNSPVAQWDSGATYTIGSIVQWGGGFWISLIDSNTGIPPSLNYTVATAGTTQPAWTTAISPITTGGIVPVWNTAINGTASDSQYTWTNIGQGTQLASFGYSYVYSFRTIYGHLTTASPVSLNTGAILGPLNGSIASYSITGDIVTFYGTNNFIIGNVFTVQGLTTGTYLNGQSFTVLSSTPSATFPLTSVSIAANVLTVTADNNLVAGQQVTFYNVASATFLNGQTVTVLSSGLSDTQFEANFPYIGSYGPTSDSGTVLLDGMWTAAFDYANVGATTDSGTALPLIATVTGAGCGSSLCTSVATITAVAVSANIVTITAANNFQPGLWVTFTGLTGATFLNGQQLQVITVDQLVGTENTYFQVEYVTPNYLQTSDSGTATFNAVEIYRTSDGGGIYLFCGAVSDPGINAVWSFNDFVPDTDLDILLVAPLAHLNDPPPGAPGSSISQVGTVVKYWQGRVWMTVGNYVYFSAGPDCTNGIPEEAWPPSYRFQFSGNPFGLETTPDGTGMMVYLADRVDIILGGPETINFYATDFLKNFGISSTNTLFRDGSTIGQFTTQKQYIELIQTKEDIGQHIADYLTENFASSSSYAAMHRDGLDVGVYISNGVDQIVRYSSNIAAWSVPYYPVFGAGAIQSVETAVGVYTLMAASPTGGKTSALGPLNPISATSVTGSGTAWVNPSNVTLGNPADYATVSFSGASSSQILRTTTYVVPHAGTSVNPVPNTAVVQGISITFVGKQSTATDLNVTIVPTGNVAGAETHTFQFGTTNTSVTFGSASDLWGMHWNTPAVVNSSTGIGFDITATSTNGSATEVEIAIAQITITYQNPGNYLYARDLDSWGDCGTYGANNGTSYENCYITVGSIQLAKPGGEMVPLQHVVGYFDAVGTLDNGGPSLPDIWILPNEISADAGVGFVYLPVILPEPPEGQNLISKSITMRRWPVDMTNSTLMSQYIAHMQIKVEFQPENAPNVIKSLAFKMLQEY